MDVRAILTVPPHADFVAEVAAHPLVAGLRLNTVMPLAAPIPEVLERLAGFGQPLWVDLKGRQLRLASAAVPPFTEVRLSHHIRVPTPCDVFFRDGREHARVMAVDGDRLILDDGPRRVLGPGESVNVVHSALEVEGTLTAGDRAFLAAMRELGLRHVLLSFTEHVEDVSEVQHLLPGAEVACKIESRRGLALARRQVADLGRLVAARGDLYVELREPHRIASAVRDVIHADPEAWVASRIFPGLAHDPVPACPEIGDVAWLLSLGYRTFLLGDEICLHRESATAALNLLAAVARDVATSS